MHLNTFSHFLVFVVVSVMNWQARSLFTLTVFSPCNERERWSKLSFSLTSPFVLHWRKSEWNLSLYSFNFIKLSSIGITFSPLFALPICPSFGGLFPCDAPKKELVSCSPQLKDIWLTSLSAPYPLIFPSPYGRTSDMTAEGRVRDAEGVKEPMCIGSYGGYDSYPRRTSALVCLFFCVDIPRKCQTPRTANFQTDWSARCRKRARERERERESAAECPTTSADWWSLL